MLRKFLLPALAIATLAGCATGYGYRGGNGDYYYGQSGVDYRYYGTYGHGYGRGYYLDVFGRPVYGYPYGYYGGSYPRYPHGHGPRPPHGPGHGGHDGDHDDDHAGAPAHGPRPGHKPPWRDIGRFRERGDDQPQRPRRLGEADERPFVQRPPAPARPPAPVMRERSESRPAGVVRGGGSGERARTRGVRPSANE